MMKKNWIQSFGLADERFIDEANPYRVVKRRRRTIALVAAVACLMGALSAAFWMIPLFRDKEGSLERYRVSPYYDLIQKLDAYKKEKDKNSYGGGLKGEPTGSDGAPPMAEMPSEGAPDSAEDMGSYEEITDNQVAGVIEGDRIKRTDRYVFYLQNNGMINAYSIEGENSQKVGSYELTVSDAKENFSARDAEIYLSSDGKRLTVMMPIYSFTKGQSMVRICQLDTSDPANMRKAAETTIEGNYISTRMVDGDFLVLTNYRLNWGDVDYTKPSTFVPCVKNPEGEEQPIAQGNILCPADKITYAGYAVAARIDGETLETAGSGAFLSFTGDVYVTGERIYAFYSYLKTETEGNLVTNEQMTEIMNLSYRDGQKDFVPGRAVTVEGSVKDRYSLDEKDGILRVVTTTSISQYRVYQDGEHASSSDWQSMTNANLYCIDVASGRVVAEVAAFAPVGESVQSVRYDGDYAYVCTAIVFSDPVFFFDLSDLDNITYKETEPIDGFSSSLVNFEHGNLLGIGRTDWDTLKVEIYKEGEENVESVCKYELRGVSYSTDYKSYYIDRKNQIVGLAVYDYASSHDGVYYLVLHFDGEDLVELAKEPLKGDHPYLRGMYVDSYFYFFGENDFKVKELNLQ